MKKLKAYSISIILVLVVLFFCGCSKVSYSVIQYPNGKISQTFQVSVDKEMLINQGLDETDVANLETKIKSVLKDVVDKLILEFRAEAQEIYKDDIVTYSKVITKVENGLTKGVAVKDNFVVAEFLFEDYITYKYFYNINDETSSNTEKKQTFLYNVNLTNSLTPFATYENSAIFLDAVTEIENYVLENNIQNVAGEIFSREDLVFNYCYVVPAGAKMHSDADYVSTINGLEYHVWKMDSSNLAREISLYTLSPRTYIWYGLALILTLILMIILFFVCFIKCKKDKKVEKKEEMFLNDIDFKKESDIISE